MVDSQPLRLAVVCEATADKRTATGLADRVLCNEVDWLADVLHYCHEWVGADGEPYLSWKATKNRAHAAGLRIRGGFSGDAEPDAQAARRAEQAMKAGRTGFGVINDIQGPVDSASLVPKRTGR